MARHAGGCLPITRLDGFSVIAAIISGLLVGVAARTGDLGRRGFMRRRFDIGVAIDAGEHSAMDRCLEPFRVDVEADRLAVNVLRHGGIAMTGQAFLIGGLGSGRLWDGACNGSCEYQTEKSKLQEPGLSPEVSSKCLHPPSSEISQPTAVLFLAVMGQGAVSALTGRGDKGHRGKFVEKRRAGAAFEPNSMVSVPGETKGRRAGTPRRSIRLTRTWRAHGGCVPNRRIGPGHRQYGDPG